MRPMDSPTLEGCRHHGRCPALSCSSSLGRDEAFMSTTARMFTKLTSCRMSTPAVATSSRSSDNTRFPSRTFFSQSRANIFRAVAGVIAPVADKASFNNACRKCGICSWPFLNSCEATSQNPSPKVQSVHGMGCRKVLGGTLF